MERLIQELQKTILALEKLSESSLPQAEQIDELLDQLFQQKIDLLNVSLNTSSNAFQQVVQAMTQAAAKAGRAVKDHGQVGGMIPVVSDAISKLARLLDQVISID